MGILIPVLKRRRFDFSHLAGGASQTVVLQPAIDAICYYYGHLLVRVHDRNMTSGQTFVFSLYYTAPSDEDTRDFTYTTSSVTDVTVDFNTSPASVPGLSQRELTSPGSYLKLELVATQASAPGKFYAELSADLVLKNG